MQVVQATSGILFLVEFIISIRVNLFQVTVADSCRIIVLLD